MATTVDTIQSRVAAIVDQDDQTGNISTSDYSLRLNYINRRERAWSEITNWDVLYTEFNTLTSTSSGNVTVSLPSDFRALSGYPKITYDGTNTDEFYEVRPQERESRNASDRFVYILGNKSDGYSLIVHPGTGSGQLSSGASIFVPYTKVAASLASPADVVTCPNPEYLVKGTIADIWKAREDARFQIENREAELILTQMLEFETTESEAAVNRRVRTIEESRYGFRWGED